MKRKRSEKCCNVENLQAALNAMGEGQTVRQAAQNFGIPKSTLHLKSKNILPLECKKRPKTILGDKLEKEIEEWIIFCADSGFPVTKSRLLECVQNFVVHNKTDTPFKDSRPGQHWYRAFMQRHSNLSNRIVQNLTSTRAAITEDDLRMWFHKVKNYLEKKIHLTLSRIEFSIWTSPLS